MSVILPDPDTNKRYNMQSAYLKKRFGKKAIAFFVFCGIMKEYIYINLQNGGRLL